MGAGLVVLLLGYLRDLGRVLVEMMTRDVKRAVFFPSKLCSGVGKRNQINSCSLCSAVVLSLLGLRSSELCLESVLVAWKMRHGISAMSVVKSTLDRFYFLGAARLSVMVNCRSRGIYTRCSQAPSDSSTAGTSAVVSASNRGTRRRTETELTYRDSISHPIYLGEPGIYIYSMSGLDDNRSFFDRLIRTNGLETKLYGKRDRLS